MHPFKKEKSLNSSQFTPVAGFLGIIIIILPYRYGKGAKIARSVKMIVAYSGMYLWTFVLLI